MECDHYEARCCRSCTLLGTDYEQQLRDKQADVQSVLALPDSVWLTPQASRETGFRNKAKFVVGGRSGAVTLGILDEQRRGVDIRDCGLLEPALAAVMPTLAAFLDDLGLEPYDVNGRRGEVKYVIATSSPDGRALVRFVLRSDRDLPRLRAALPRLLDRAPGIEVVSVNLHPEHKAVLEGDVEVPLTAATSLVMTVNDRQLRVGPRSFFQTNTEVAAALYRQAQDWAGGASTVWDLYCGVGGFALHLLDQDRSVVGIEVTAEAIDLARASAEALTGSRSGSGRFRFVAGDAAAFATSHSAPDLVVVNPPRRGLEESLALWLNQSAVRRIIYSSCNVQTLRRDLERLRWFGVRSARLFDMFPQTAHHEVMVLLEREVLATPGRRRRQHAPRR